MAKLVKLTSKEGVVNNGNSFKCQSDEDIYIEPMSTISLLNAHISSGILSSYNVDGTVVKGQDTGLHVSSLYLTEDKTDRERQIVCQNGDYNITTLTRELSRASNIALQYQSASTAVSGTSDVFTTPSESDFGLQMLSTLNTDSKVAVKFNWAAQKTTAFSCSNKSDGVQFDATTNQISYTNPTGLTSVNLNTAQANQALKQVTSVEIQNASGFAVNDSVKLVDSLNGTTATVGIAAIDATGSNLDNAIDVTVVNDVQVLSNNLFTTAIAYNKAGLEMTMDDGTSAANPVNNPVYAKIDNAQLQYDNKNLTIEEVKVLNGLNYNNTIKHTDVKDNRKRNPFPEASFEITTTLNFVDAANYGFEVGRAIVIFEDAASPYMCGIITNVSDNGGFVKYKFEQYSRIPPTTSAGNKKKINKDKLDAGYSVSFDFFLTNAGGGVEIANIPNDGTFDGSLITIYRKNLGNNTIEPLAQAVLQDIEDQPASVKIQNYIKLQPLSLVCLDETGGVLLTGLDALNRICTFYKLDDQTKNFIVFSDRVVSEKVLDATDATLYPQDGADVVIDLYTGTILNNITIPSAPYNFDIGDLAGQHGIFPIEFGAGPDVDKYKASSQFFYDLTFSQIAYSLIENDASAKLLITFIKNTISAPNNDLTQATVAPVRLWFGTNITTVYTFTLNNTGNLTKQLSSFDSMIKGTLVKSQAEALAVEDTRLSKSCGRIVFKVVNAGNCEFGIIPETQNFINQNTIDGFVRIVIRRNASGNLVYRLFKGNVQVPLKTDLLVAQGDRVCIQWGVCPSSIDFEYSDIISSATNPSTIDITDVEQSTGDYNDQDRGKMLFSVLRANRVNNYIYLGCPVGNPNETTNQDKALSKTIPWTPRANPYIPPIYYDNLGNYRVYVAPNLATVQIIELTQDPTLINVNGVLKEISGENIIYDDNLHSVDHPDLVDIPSKYTSFSQYWYWNWVNLSFQKQLGYKTPSALIHALTGSFIAQTDYLTAYLPDNIVIFLDNLPCETYDLEKVKGTRRNIIGVCINNVGKVGEINVEPNNLYKIALNNKQPINLRKFYVSFETFFGEQIQLMSAKAVVNLLIEGPK
jgi:hypothetical protein